MGMTRKQQQVARAKTARKAPSRQMTPEQRKRRAHIVAEIATLSHHVDQARVEIDRQYGHAGSILAGAAGGARMISRMMAREGFTREPKVFSYLADQFDAIAKMTRSVSSNSVNMAKVRNQLVKLENVIRAQARGL